MPGFSTHLQATALHMTANFSDQGGQVPIAADETFDYFGRDMDQDSALGDDLSLPSSTVSLRSSILRDCEENGRRYHGYKEGKYVLPVDEPELERQEFQYQLCLFTFENRLSFAPLKNMHRALDAGCGLGFWAIDFAEQNPQTEVIGVDLSPIQPPFIPPNAVFEIDDLEEAWTFSFKFDYIHTLMMTGAFRDWPNFFRQSFQHLESGGFLELQDIDFPVRCDDASLAPGSALAQWSTLLMEAGRRSGFRLDACGRAAAMMREAGFVDVVRLPFTWPIGGWPSDARQRQIGGWVEQNFADGIEAICMALFTRFLGWDRDGVVEFSARVRADLADTRIHAYFPIYVTYGRKP